MAKTGYREFCYGSDWLMAKTGYRELDVAHICSATIYNCVQSWNHRIKDYRMEKTLKGRRFMHNLL